MDCLGGLGYPYGESLNIVTEQGVIAEPLRLTYVRGLFNKLMRDLLIRGTSLVLWYFGLTSDRPDVVGTCDDLI